jgi:hypothetical protein
MENISLQSLFVLSAPNLPSFFGLTSERGQELLTNAISTAGDYIESCFTTLNNGITDFNFSQTKCITMVLSICKSIQEEAYVLFHLGKRIFELESKLINLANQGVAINLP